MAFPKVDGYTVTEKIGSGSYSTVYKAYNKVGARVTVAIKCVEKARVKHSGAAVDNLVSEIRLLKALRHPHIVRMHDFTWDDKNIYIIMEYCSGGDLAAHIRRCGRLPEPQVRSLLQQLASALQYLHERGVAHMDLKPHNLLLLSGRRALKVADFGFAAAGRAVGVRGSPLYMAPEALDGAPSPAADLWSVGVIVYECLTGAAPYASASLGELVARARRREPVEPPARASPECRRLLRALLQPDPARRIPPERFFADPYVDLEHAPSAENYERGARLVRRAVALDAAGRAAPALDAYTEGLRFLVPRAAAEDDPARRAALADKLARYMERAEQIKAFLKGTQGAPSAAPPTPPPAPPEPGSGRDAFGELRAASSRRMVSDGRAVGECAAADAPPAAPERPDRDSRPEKPPDDACRIT